MREAVIIPTGDEILNGIVTDTDSAEVMTQLIAKFPDMVVHRLCPVADLEEALVKVLDERAAKGADLLVFIGGSGGGRRFSATLSDDCTHSALEPVLEKRVSKEIYGKNGHMWCKLVCGRKGKTLVINLPGPFREARAAVAAFCGAYSKACLDLSAINSAMVQAVIEQYG